jgi:uncharacterized membrane protein
VPFCTNCGAKVDASAAFCFNCGTAQTHRAEPQYQDFLHGMTDRTAAVLCYIPVFGVIPAIIFLANQKYRSNRRIRFEAFQSLYLFIAWLIVSAAAPMFMFGFVGFHTAGLKVVKLGMFVIWVYLLIKASRDEPTHIPIIGDLAARSAAEQL